MQEVLTADFTDSFASALFKKFKLTNIFTHQAHAFSENENTKVAILKDIFHSWDGLYHPGSREATLFSIYLSNAVRILFVDIGD